MPSRTLKTIRTWNNFVLDATCPNIGCGWVLNPNGDIVRESFCEEVVIDGRRFHTKMYLGVPEDFLVINWLFPNVYVGHIFWFSQTPTQITSAQMLKAEHLESILIREWNEYAKTCHTKLPLIESGWKFPPECSRAARPLGGSEYNFALENLSTETINHYANRIEENLAKFKELNIEISIDRKNGVVEYTGNNGTRTYPLNKVGYSTLMRAMNRVRNYRNLTIKTPPHQHE